MSRIFISYRRVDTEGYTGRLFDRLKQRFGQGNVFMDVTGIEYGLDFYEVIEEAVGSCDALIAMIGPRWLTVTDDGGRRRLDNPDDFVRLEIRTALKRNIRVIPALVGGVSMPRPTDLPEDLRLLTRRNALKIGDDFHPTVDRLIAVLEKVLGVTTPSPVMQPPPKPKTLTLTNPFQMELIRIPAGKFLMGSDPAKDKEARDYEQPQHTVNLPDFYIARYPVTNAQFAAWKGDKEFPQSKADHPVVEVDWHEAVAFCRWLSQKSSHTVRLPTEAEWEKAARGTDGWIYPWGNAWDKSRCNTIEGGLEDTTPVGRYSPAGDSLYGVGDMAGNVFEWCSTIWAEKAYPFQVQDEWTEVYLRTDVARVLRGGAWSYGRSNCSDRNGYNPHGWYYGVVGFRVLVVPI